MNKSTTYGLLCYTGNKVSCRLRYTLDAFNNDVIHYFNRAGIRLNYEYGIHSKTTFKGNNYITVNIICSYQQYKELLVLTKKRQIRKLEDDIRNILL